MFKESTKKSWKTSVKDHLIGKAAVCNFSKNQHSQGNFSRAQTSLKVSVYILKFKNSIFQMLLLSS